MRTQGENILNLNRCLSHDGLVMNEIFPSIIGEMTR